MAAGVTVLSPGERVFKVAPTFVRAMKMHAITRNNIMSLTHPCARSTDVAFSSERFFVKEDYSVLLIQLDRKLASDVSARSLRMARASGRNVGS